jgi:hypothetical protein
MIKEVRPDSYDTPVPYPWSRIETTSYPDTNQDAEEARE